MILLNKLEFINSTIIPTYFWNKKNIINTTYYNWAVYNIKTNFINTYRKYGVVQKPTWGYYDTFQAEDVVYQWNYYELKTRYIYNKYNRVDETIDTLWLNSDEEVKIVNFDSKVVFKEYDAAQGKYVKNYLLQLLHTNGTMLTLELTGSPNGYIDIQLGDYYNQGYFAICFDNVPKPFLLIKEDSYLDFSLNGVTTNENG